MKYLLLLVGFCLAMGSALPIQGQQTHSQDLSRHEHRADSLLQLMTLEEKIGQLNLSAGGDATTGERESSDVLQKVQAGHIGGIFNVKGADKIRPIQEGALRESRLGIPLLFGMDVIHGYETIFPIPIGLSTTWNMELVEASAQIAAREAAADGIAWTFSPMTDISRDPRWGRVSEGSGEDPYLASLIAAAMVKGYQGEDLADAQTLMACLKHFALYGAGEAGRDYNTVDMSRLRMFNEYFPPYKAAIDAGVGSVMTSFNEVDGIPASANRWLLHEVLRERWGFDGFIVTDYTAINEMVDHGIGDLETVSALALRAGVDMDMVGEGFLTTLKTSLEAGRITEAEIDQACRRVLIAKSRLGLFEDPFRYGGAQNTAERPIFTAEHRAFARKVAVESFVLLQNKAQLLPLAPTQKIALIGPMADNVENMVGTWSITARTSASVSVEEGLRRALLQDGAVTVARGANVAESAALESRVSIFGKPTYRDERPEEELIAEALKVAESADVIVAALGESAEMSGESSSLTDIRLQANQRRLLEVLQATGKPVVLLLFTGRPLDLSEVLSLADAILCVWFPGSEAGDAIADVLFGSESPSGKLSMTFPRHVGQIPLHYNHKNTGRPLPDGEWFRKFRSNYLDRPNTPLFPFGYGLSYSTFTLSAPKVNKERLKGEEEVLELRTTLQNTGDYEAAEVVQLYIRDLVGSITRPVKELKGFQKIRLAPGESREVVFRIQPEDLKFYNYALEFDWEEGAFDLMVGPNAENLQSVQIYWEK
ncbi:MAG: beta-glucosidase BglX [Nitritalea sp.]